MPNGFALFRLAALVIGLRPKGGFIAANQYKEDFTVRRGKTFSSALTSPHNWVYAMYLLVTARKGIFCPCNLRKRSALHKNNGGPTSSQRGLAGSDPKKLQGIVEPAKTYIGGQREKQA